MSNLNRETKGRRIAREMDDLADAIKGRKPLEERYTVHTCRRVRPLGEYGAQRIRRVRDGIGVSQPVFADMLGVSASLVPSWEQGFRKPSRMACRLLDEIDGHRERWLAVLTG